LGEKVKTAFGWGKLYIDVFEYMGGQGNE